MPQPKKATRFGGSPAHHNLMLSNLATELLRHGRIRTTQARARSVQPLAERMITLGKRGDLHSRRQALKVIRDRDVIHKLFADVGPAFAERDGGYTRLLKLGPRKGDAAPMALLELVEGVSTGGEGDLAEAPRRRWSLRRRRGGTLSATARERSEDRAAAVDRGEVTADAGAAADADSELVGEPVDEEGTQADPAEVEARLAAQEQAAQDEARAAEEAQADTEGPGENRN